MAKQQKETTNAKQIPFDKSIKSFRQNFGLTAAQHAEKAEMMASKLPEEPTQVEKDAVSRERTHAAYDMKIADMTDAAVKYALAELGVTKCKEIENQSRELKKRTVAILEAVGHGDLVEDRALDAVMQYLATKKVTKITTRKIQSEAQHETSTQANYMKTAFAFLGMGEVTKIEKGVWEINFDSKSGIFSELMNIYHS